MSQFNNAHQSHEHSMYVLNLLREHDTFMESISSVADMGAGQCLDTLWWANATTRDEPRESLNLKCYAVDRQPMTIDFEQPKNFTYIQRDFEKPCLPSPVARPLSDRHDPCRALAGSSIPGNRPAFELLAKSAGRAVGIAPGEPQS